MTYTRCLFFSGTHHLDGFAGLGIEHESGDAERAPAVPPHTHDRDRQHPRDPAQARARRALVVPPKLHHHALEHIGTPALGAVAGLGARQSANARVARGAGDVPACG